MSDKRVPVLVLGLLIVCFLVACGAQETGRLEFRANGEDFVRQGFVSKDGWAISFDHVYVSVSDIHGYQSDPPYDPHAGGEVNAQTEVRLDGASTIDLAEGGAEAEPLMVGAVDDAPAGQYNALSWEMTRAADGPASGYALVIDGRAEKDTQVVDFVIQVETEYLYTCGEYVGDVRKGFLDKDGTADLEMTFHFDHVFGDAGTPLDDDLNLLAPGFEPFASAAGGSKTLEIDMAGLEAALSPEDYKMLVGILPTLGHAGEGHCHSETR